MTDYKKIKLKNGLRIITAPVFSTKTVTVIVMVGVGSRHESKNLSGLSHFLEHMLFKGTKKRPSALAISEELDEVGGEFNAFTAKDKTGYYAKVDYKHIDIALDVVSDIYLNSKIDGLEIEKEKGTIIQELNMYEDTPTRNVTDVFEKLLYAKNSLGREIIGTKETIQSFKRKDFIGYMEKFYAANNTAICVAGKFDEKQVVKKIKGYFGKMKSGKKNGFMDVFENQKKPEIGIKTKKTDQSHVVIGVRAFDMFNKDRFALSLLAVILGGNMSSRLFTQVREKLGLAYYIRTNVELFADCGYIATQAGVEHKNLEQAIKTILLEYKKIAGVKISEKELRRSKDYVKSRIIMGMEASDEVGMFYLEQEINREIIMNQSEIFDAIEKVTPNDILKVARDVFKNHKLNAAVIGPWKDKNKLKQILKI